MTRNQNRSQSDTAVGAERAAGRDQIEQVADDLPAVKTQAGVNVPVADRLVPMTRNDPAFPQGPFTADVHPDEVDSYSRHGWRRA